MHFIQHKFEPKVAYYGREPVVFVSRIAYNKMAIYVDIASKEVGWLGRAIQLADGNILIDDVYLFRQEVNSGTCEITPDGLAEFAQDLLNKYENGMEVINDLRFWGHSHVNGGTSPSHQDDTQMDVFCQNGCGWFVRGIFNKNGRMEYTIYLYDQGIKITDAEWHLYEPEQRGLREEIEIEFAEKVTEKKYHSNVSYVHSKYNGFGFDDFDPMGGIPTWAIEDEKATLGRQEMTEEELELLAIQQELELLAIQQEEMRLECGKVHSLSESTPTNHKKDPDRRSRLPRVSRRKR